MTASDQLCEEARHAFRPASADPCATAGKRRRSPGLDDGLVAASRVRLRRDPETARPRPGLACSPAGPRRARGSSGARRSCRDRRGRMRRWRRQCRCALNWDHGDAFLARPIHADGHGPNRDISYDHPDADAHGFRNDRCTAANRDDGPHTDDNGREDHDGCADGDSGSGAPARNDLRHDDERREPGRGRGGRSGGGVEQGRTGNEHPVGLDRLWHPRRSGRRRRDHLVAAPAFLQGTSTPGSDSTGSAGVSSAPSRPRRASSRPLDQWRGIAIRRKAKKMAAQTASAKRAHIQLRAGRTAR